MASSRLTSSASPTTHAVRKRFALTDSIMIVTVAMASLLTFFSLLSILVCMFFTACMRANSPFKTAATERILTLTSQYFASCASSSFSKRTCKSGSSSQSR